MIRVLDSRLNGPGLSSGAGRRVVFLSRETLYSLNVSLHLVIKMSTGEFNARGKPCDGLTFQPGKYSMSLHAAEIRDNH